MIDPKHLESFVEKPLAGVVLSKCCRAEIVVKCGAPRDECSACHKPCDVIYEPDPNSGASGLLSLSSESELEAR